MVLFLNIGSDNTARARCRPLCAAFSLVELSIVLVILGLLVGGILSGKSLIESAALRAQMKQIEGYRIAAMAFKDKYFYLPGDLPEPTATSAGFQPRGVSPGMGDGNGIIAGARAGAAYQYYMNGESVVFWTDLSKAGLIEGSYTTATANGGLPLMTTASQFAAYFPAGKINNTSVYVAGGSQGLDGGFLKDPKSYFGLQKFLDTNTDWISEDSSDYGLSVVQAYNIDMKADDGMPITGKIGAMRMHHWIIRPKPGASGAIAPDSTTCVDNGNNAAAPLVYSVANDAAKNCSLFFELM